MMYRSPDGSQAGNISRQPLLKHWDLYINVKINKSYQFKHRKHLHCILDYMNHNTRLSKLMLVVVLRKKRYTKRCRRLKFLIPVV